MLGPLGLYSAGKITDFLFTVSSFPVLAFDLVIFSISVDTDFTFSGSCPLATMSYAIYFFDFLEYSVSDERVHLNLNATLF